MLFLFAILQIFDVKIKFIFLCLQLNNTNLEISENDLIHFLESISTEEMKNVNFNFHSKELNIKADIIITLTKGFPPLKLEFELDLMDNNFVSIEVFTDYNSSIVMAAVTL